MTVKFQSKTFKVARFRARGKVEGEDVEDADLDPMHARMRTAGPEPRDKKGQQDLGDVMNVDEDKGHCSSSTGTPENGEGRHPCAGLPLPICAASVSTWIPG